MADIVTPEKRSQMMAGIKGKNTRPEMAIRTGLHKIGFRYRIHVRDMPGKPDMIFPKFRAVLFVHGCFWHHHDCHLFKWPSSRVEFWRTKIDRNVEVDRLNIEKLREAGWRIGIVWECAVKGRTRKPLPEVIENCRDWLLTREGDFELRGNG